MVLCAPEIRRVTLPAQGARLIIASDGLWDAMNPKTAVHHVRGMQASKAAQELVSRITPSCLSLVTMTFPVSWRLHTLFQLICKVPISHFACGIFHIPLLLAPVWHPNL